MCQSSVLLGQCCTIKAETAIKDGLTSLRLVPSQTAFSSQKMKNVICCNKEEFNRDLQTRELPRSALRKLQQEGPYPEIGKIPAIQVNSFLQSDQDAKEVILGTTALQ